MNPLSSRHGTRHRSGPAIKANALILFASFLSLVPAIFLHQLLQGDDAGIHLRWQRAYAPEVWSGILMPRWLETLNDGYGSPAFFIYPPFGQWVASAFYPFLPSAQDSALRLSLSLVLASALGGAGAYFWLGRVVEARRAALFGALLYVLLPYHLYIDTYHRVAFGELWGMAAAPWMFFGAVAIFDRTRFARTVFACAVAAVLLCNAPSALMLLPTIASYVLLLAWSRQDARGMAGVVLAGLLGSMVAGAYLSTALTHTRYIDMTALFNESGPRWWVFSPGNSGGKPTLYFLAAGTLAFQSVLAIAFASVAGFANLKPQARRAAAFCGAIVVVTTVLQTDLGSRFWSPSNPFSMIQFPWRLQTLQMLAVGGLGAFAFQRWAKSWSATLAPFALTVLLVTATVSAGLLTVRAMHYEDIGKPASNGNTTHTEREDAREYRLAEIDSLPRSFGSAKAIIESGRGEVMVDDWSSRSIRLSTESVEGTSVLLHQFNYTGWRYRLDSAGWEPTQSAGPLVRIAVPAGRHAIELEMRPIQAERLGTLCSIAGLAGLAALVSFELMDARRRGFTARPSFRTFEDV